MPTTTTSRYRISTTTTYENPLKQSTKTITEKTSSHNVIALPPPEARDTRIASPGGDTKAKVVADNLQALVKGVNETTEVLRRRSKSPAGIESSPSPPPPTKNGDKKHKVVMDTLQALVKDVHETTEVLRKAMTRSKQREEPPPVPVYPVEAPVVIEIPKPVEKKRDFIDYFPQVSPTGEGKFRSATPQDLASDFGIQVPHTTAPKRVTTPSSRASSPLSGDSDAEERRTPFRPSSRNDKPDKNVRICAASGLPITGACLTAVSSNSKKVQYFRPECFVCTYCLRPLNFRGVYKEHELKPYCHECFFRLYSGPIM